MCWTALLGDIYILNGGRESERWPDGDSLQVGDVVAAVNLKRW